MHSILSKIKHSGYPMSQWLLSCPKVLDTLSPGKYCVKYFVVVMTGLVFKFGSDSIELVHIVVVVACLPMLMCL
jgi:hypothetical protein